MKRLIIIILFIFLSVYLNIIQNILSPGIYGDIGIGYLSFIAGIFEREEDTDASNNSFGGWVGIHIYNRFSFGSFHLQPSLGFTFYGFSNIGLPVTSFGILAAYRHYGIEYSFHLPFNRERIFYIHRLAFVLHFF